MGDDVKETKPCEDVVEKEKTVEKMNSAESTVCPHIDAILDQLRESGAAPILVTGASEGQDAESRTKFVLETVLVAERTVVSDLLNVLTKLELNSAHEALLELLPERQDTEGKTTITETVQDKTMPDEGSGSDEPRPYKEVLKESSGTFIDCLHPTSSLLEHLQAKSVLSPDMVDKVRCRPNRPDKVRVLLELLMTLGPQSLMSFIGALRATDQHFLANILASTTFI